MDDNSFYLQPAAINKKSQATMSFSITNPLYSGCLIDVTLPSDIGFDQSLTIQGSAGIKNSVRYEFISEFTVRIFEGFDQYTIGPYIVIIFGNITNPSSTQPTQNFIVTTRSPDLKPIDTAGNGRIIAQPGQITSVSGFPIVTIRDTRVNVQTTYDFEFSLTDPVPSSGVLTIHFPPSVSVAALPYSRCGNVSFGISPDSYCEIQGKILIITSGFPSGFTGGNVKFSINNITNPPTTAITQSFKIYTYTDNQRIYRIDTVESGVTIQTQPTPLQGIQITLASYIAGVSTVYRIQIETSNQIPAQGYVLVKLPVQVKVNSITAAKNGCVPVLGFSEATFYCDVTESSITVKGGFDDGPFESGLLVFEISNILNPASTKPTSSFTISTHNGSGDKIDETSNGIILTMTTPNTFQNVIVTPASLRNGDITEYRFQITVSNETPNPSIYKITPPDSVDFPDQAVGRGEGNVSDISITVNSGIYSVTCTLSSSPVQPGTIIDFVLEGIRNPGTTQSSKSFTIYSFTWENYALEKKTSGILVKMIEPGYISNIVIAPGNSNIAAESPYTISYVPTNVHPIGTTLEIEIPVQFIVNNLQCTTTTLNPTLACLVTGRKLTITDGFVEQIESPKMIDIKIMGITNPATQDETSPWRLTTKIGAYLIDASTDITTQFTCRDPCATCSLDPRSCTSCLPDSPTPYFYNNTCNSFCLAKYVDDQQTSIKQCVPCQFPCVNCKDTPQKCTSCNIQGSYPYLYSDSCHNTCNEGEWGDGENCYQCTNPCKTCTSLEDCKSCDKFTKGEFAGAQGLLFEKRCYPECPDGYIQNSNNVCELCDANCLTCESAKNQCTSCQPGKKLRDTTCVEYCPLDNRYIDQGNVCERCKSNCDTCLNTTIHCTSCLEGYRLYNNICYDICPSGTTAGYNTCKPCTGDCETCNLAPNVCTSCKDNKFVYKTQCVTECPIGTLQSGGSCIACEGDCSTCEGSTTFCTGCKPGKYLLNGICQEQCPINTHVHQNWTCVPCVSSCKTCAGTADYCISCQNNQKLYKGQCLTVCPNNSIDRGDYCEPCDQKCASCVNEITNCTSCISGYVLSNNVCIDACPGTSIEVQGVCMPCNDSCLTCSGTSSTCSSCKSNLYLYQGLCLTECPQNYAPLKGNCELLPEPPECAPGCSELMYQNSSCDAECNFFACNYDNGSCNSGPMQCPDGYYKQGGQCIQCVGDCDTCLSEHYCLSCVASGTGQLKLLFEGQCYDQCPEGTLKTGIACQACDSRCKGCLGQIDNCVSCADNLFLYNNQCTNSCPADITITMGNKCQDCSINCNTCAVNYDNCTGCSENKVLYGNTCLTQCPDGYTLQPSTGNVCMKCVSECQTCSSSINNCVTCPEGKKFYNNKCYDTCPIKTYSSGDNCLDCDNLCMLCEPNGVCIVCANGKVKFNNVCLEACPAGYQPVNNVCQEVPPVIECVEGCTESLLNNGICDPICNVVACNSDNKDCEHSGECPAGQFFSQSQCKDCSYPCLKCTSPSTCTSCNYVPSGPREGELLLFYNSSCYEECPEGTMQQGIMCYKCNSSCKNCAGNVDTCTECSAGKYLYQGTCVSQCPLEVTVPSGLICLECSSNCKTCSGTYNNCTACAEGLLLEDGKCISACGPGYTVASAFPKKCTKCIGSCQECEGEAYKCTSCTDDKLLYKSTCVDACPANITVQIDNKCIPCQSPCLECNLQTDICTRCIANMYLFQSSCIPACPDGYQARLGICEPLCANNCTQELLQNTVCDIVCNLSSCTYDNGACLPLSGCPLGSYRKSADCLPCESPCNTCSTASYCDSCEEQNGFQLLYYKGKCLNECPSGTYQQGITCYDCDSNCKECKNSPDYCVQCVSQLKLYENECIPSCPVGTTIEQNGNCVECSTNCKFCQFSTENCTKCPIGGVLSQGKCIAECPDGETTTETSVGNCIACSANCLTCIETPSNCTSCDNGLILHQNQCLAKCPSGYTITTLQPDICSKCSSACLECEGGIDICTLCPAGQTLSEAGICQGVPECPDGTTLTPSSQGICVNCASPCLTCFGDISSCTSCEAGLTYQNGVCVPCNEPCQTCSGSPDICTSCLEGYFVSGANCIQCGQGCATCTGASYNCQACTPGYFLSGSECLPCNSNCQTCGSMANECTSCISSKILKDNKCLSCDPLCKTCENEIDNCSSCFPRYYQSGTTCLLCDDSCAECSNQPSFCTKCYQGKTLIAGKCDTCKNNCKTCQIDFNVCDSCPDGYQLINGVCGICRPECATCINDFNTCGSCPPGRYLKDGQCLSCDSNCKTCTGESTNCLDCNFPLSLIGNKCIVCDSTCKTCFGDQYTCTSCDPPLALIGTSCLSCSDECKTCSGTINQCSSCENGKYLRNKQCQLCDENCLTCDTSSTNCTSCGVGMQIVGNRCKVICPDGFYDDGDGCKECSTNCKTCVTTADTCTSCEKGFIFQDRCINNCETGWYWIGLTCEKCQEGCKECEGRAGNCLSCIPGYRLNVNKCEFICPVGKYLSGGACLECLPNCRSCEVSASKCTSCHDDSMIINSVGACEVPCEIGYTRTPASNGQCLKCVDYCYTCSGSVDNCTSCSSSSTFLYQGNCVNNCPIDRTVAIGSKCIDCDDNCKTCVGDIEFCTSCYSGQYLTNNECLDKCPTGYYGVGQTCQQCQDPTDCPPGSSNGSEEPKPSTNTTSNATEDDFSAEKVPFPFTGFSLISLGFIAATKLAAANVGFISSSVGVFGVMAPASWIVISIYLPESHLDSSRRLQLDISGEDAIPGAAFITVVFGICAQVICNIAFTIIFFTKISKSDAKYSLWKKSHKLNSFITPGLSFLVSFHCIRLLFSRLCNMEAFNAKFQHQIQLLKNLLKFTYINIVLTILPIIVGLVLLLSNYSSDQIIWAITLDSFIITICMLLFLVMDMRKVEKKLYKAEWIGLLEAEENWNKRYLKKIMSILPTRLNKQKPQMHQRSFSLQELPYAKSPLKMSKSLTNEEVVVDPDILGIVNLSYLGVDVEDYLYDQISNKDLSDTSFYKEELTILVDDEKPPEKGFFQAGINEKKIDTTRFSVQSFNPLQEDVQIVTTELVAYTEEEASEPEDQPDDDFSNIPNLGQIENEAELDISRAIKDAVDPNQLVVTHKGTGQRLLLRQTFNGAKIIDPKTNAALHAQRVNIDEIDEALTIVDESDPRFATLTTHSNQKIRARRNLTGAMILELIPSSTEFNADLIGLTVSSEEDFGFHSAIVDMNDQDVVIVKHIETGEIVRVRKNFHGAKIVDGWGRVKETKPPINLFDYNEEITIDPDDVHLGILTHSQTGEPVSARRSFIGGKVLSIERQLGGYASDYDKVSGPSRGETMPMSPGLSSPDYSVQEKPITAAGQRLKDADDMLASSKKPEEGRKRLANLAQIIQYYDDDKRQVISVSDIKPTVFNETAEKPLLKDLNLDELDIQPRITSSQSVMRSRQGNDMYKQRRAKLIENNYIQQSGVRHNTPTPPRPPRVDGGFNDIMEAYKIITKDSVLHNAGGQISQTRKK